jgi:tetratricopeptide (TPR) repeat protein
MHFRVLFLISLLVVLYSNSVVSQESAPAAGEVTQKPETKPNLTGMPRVCRVQLKLVVDGEVQDVIEKGDLLTVLEEREESFLVQTYTGRKASVAKVNAVAIAEASDIYTELIDAAPDQGRLYTLRAGAFAEAGKQAEALADFNRAIELGYTQPHAYFSRGSFQAAVGDYDKALQDYAIAIEKDPKQVPYYVNRAAVYMSINEFAKAKDDYDKAIAIDTKNSALVQQRAIALKAMGDLPASIAEFGLAIELDPKNIPAIMGRGFVYFQIGNHQEAVDDFAQVIELNPNAAVAYNNRGYNYQQLGEDAKALSDFDKAIELESAYGLAHQNRAWSLLTAKDTSLRDKDEALKSANKACELSEFKNPGDLAALAAAHAANGDFEVALGWQEKVITMVTEDQRPFARAVMTLYEGDKEYDAPTAIEIAASVTKLDDKSKE